MVGACGIVVGFGGDWKGVNWEYGRYAHGCGCALVEGIDAIGIVSVQ